MNKIIRKKLVILVLFALIITQIDPNRLVTYEVMAKNDYSPTDGDFGITTVVDLLNLSVNFISDTGSNSSTNSGLETNSTSLNNQDPIYNTTISNSTTVNVNTTSYIFNTTNTDLSNSTNTIANTTTTVSTTVDTITNVTTTITNRTDTVTNTTSKMFNTTDTTINITFVAINTTVTLVNSTNVVINTTYTVVTNTTDLLTGSSVIVTNINSTITNTTYIDSNTTITLTNRTFTTVTMRPSKSILNSLLESQEPLLYFPKLQVIAGSSPQTLLESLNSHISTDVPTFTPGTQNLLKFLDPSIPSITSFSASGYKKINQFSLDKGYQEIPIRWKPVNLHPNLKGIYQSSLEFAFQHNLLRLITNTTTSNSTTPIKDLQFNETDFLSNIGTEDNDQMRISTKKAVEAQSTIYENTSNVQISGDIDPDLVEYADTFSDQNLQAKDIAKNYNRKQKQLFFFSGYNNFEHEAVETPVIDYAVNFFWEEYGISLDKSRLDIQYDTLDDIKVETQISSNLRDHMVKPLKDAVKKRDTEGQNDIIGYILQVKFLNFPILKVERTDALFGIELPNINVGGIVNGVVNTVKNGVSSVGKVINGAKKIVKDTTGSIARGLLNNPITRGIHKTVSLTAKFAGNAIRKVGTITKDVVKKAGKMLNPKSWFGAIASTIMSFLRPFIPLILGGLGVIVAIALGYMLLPKIIGKLAIRNRR